MVEFTILALKRPFQVVRLGPSHQYRFHVFQTAALSQNSKLLDENHSDVTRAMRPFQLSGLGAQVQIQLLRQRVPSVEVFASKCFGSRGRAGFALPKRTREGHWSAEIANSGEFSRLAQMAVDFERSTTQAGDVDRGSLHELPAGR